LEGLDDIGPEIAKNVIEYFSYASHKRILSELVEILDIKYYTSVPVPLLTGEGKVSFFY
jgi:hypothetical protein